MCFLGDLILVINNTSELFNVDNELVQACLFFSRFLCEIPLLNVQGVSRHAFFKMQVFQMKCVIVHLGGPNIRCTLSIINEFLSCNKLGILVVLVVLVVLIVHMVHMVLGCFQTFEMKLCNSLAIASDAKTEFQLLNKLRTRLGVASEFANFESCC